MKNNVPVLIVKIVFKILVIIALAYLIIKLYVRRMEYMTKELKKQTIANKKWEEKNKEYSSYLKSRSSARSFIKNKATLEDLEQLEEFIKNRREELNK